MKTHIHNACIFISTILLSFVYAFSGACFDADTEHADRFYKSGVKNEAKQKYGKAINAYYHATLVSPDFAKAHRCIGRVYVKKGLHKNALKALKEAYYLDKYDRETHYYLGIVYPLVEHNSEKALEHFKLYMTVDSFAPPDPKKMKKVKQWIRKLKRMGDVKRDQVLIDTYNKAVDLDHQKKYSEARKMYKKALDRNPHYAPAYEGLGLVNIKLKKFEGALYAFQEALLIDPYRPEAHYGLGIVYPITRNDEKKAVYHFERYIELAPKADDIPKVKGWIAQLKEKNAARSQEVSFYNEGVEAFDNGDFQAAKEHYTQALNINPDYADAYQGLGLALVQLGEYEDARTAFEDALDLDPEFAEAHYGLGIVSPLLGDKTNAITHFWKYLEYNPDAPDLKQVLKWIEELEGG
ncbi:MAG: tetratricopeptide repeat protein [Candidatus Ancaeobacter aquaticus]|nr:tetratricopeptide repeat protein [Candidatus Ancaeobacter aquaticus]